MMQFSSKIIFLLLCIISVFGIFTTAGNVAHAEIVFLDTPWLVPIPALTTFAIDHGGSRYYYMNNWSEIHPPMPPEAVGKANGIILEIETMMNGPDWIRIFDGSLRKPQPSTVYISNGNGYIYRLLEGRASGGGDEAGFAQQGVFGFNKAGNFFRFLIDSPGFNEGIVIRVVGYMVGEDTKFFRFQNVGSANTDGFGNFGDRTFTNANGYVATDATAVFVQGEANMDWEHDTKSHIVLRKNAFSPWYDFLGGEATQRGDIIAWGGVGFTPVSSGQFQYAVQGAFDHWRLRVIGSTKERMQFITPIDVTSAGCLDGGPAHGFCTFPLPNSIPGGSQGAMAIILDARADMDRPDGGLWNRFARVYVRRSQFNPGKFVLLGGRAAGGSDDLAWAGQGIFPLSADGRSFQYSVEGPGFNQGMRIRVIGYVLPPTGGLNQQCDASFTCDTGFVPIDCAKNAGDTACTTGFSCACKPSTTYGNFNQPCLFGGTCGQGVCAAEINLCAADGGLGEYCKTDGSCDVGLQCRTASSCVSGIELRRCINPLVANFDITSPNPLEGHVPFEVTTDASASVGDIDNYVWDWRDSSVTQGASASSAHFYTDSFISGSAVPFTRPVTLTVEHITTYTPTALFPPIPSCTIPDSITSPLITIKPPLPDASFNIMPEAGTPPKDVSLDAFGSKSNIIGVVGNGISEYLFRFFDGKGNEIISRKSVVPFIEFIFARVQEYVVSLVVTDAETGYKSIAVTRTFSGLEKYTCIPQCSGDTPVCGPAFSGFGNTCFECTANVHCDDGYTCSGDNTCILSEGSAQAQCYVEEFGSCFFDSDCTDGITGGVCNQQKNVCRYARCFTQASTPTANTCSNNEDCSTGDGICNKAPAADTGSCVYVYECAYGPGLGKGVPGRYDFIAPALMPPMPLGVQAEGQACTKPTFDAPNNCEGVNGCLYYNYTDDGTTSPAGHSSVANCLNISEQGTGCVYYQDGKTNCLPSRSNAGIPAGCFVVEKGNDVQEYDCTAVDGCYYQADGSIDCTYSDGIAKGTGCLYEPNPAVGIDCPGATNAPSAGDNFVACLLNPDALLPSFLLGSNQGGLSPCRTDVDCPVDNVCLDGTCFLQCSGNVDCISGLQCVVAIPSGGGPGGPCQTQADCDGDLLCNLTTNTCVIPPNGGGSCIPGTFCPDGQVCPINGICPATPFCTGGFPKGSLSFGTTQTDIGFSTTIDASCRYTQLLTDLSGPFESLSLFATTGATDHETSVSGLIPSSSGNVLSNVYYASCQEIDTGDMIPVCQIAFGVGAPCSSNAQCGGGLSCVNGFCQFPECLGATPNGVLAFGAGTTDISMDTSQDANCKYSTAVPSFSQSPIDQFSSLSNSFAATGGTTHIQTGVSLPPEGNSTYYVKCQETSLPNDITATCQISFNVGLCNEEFQCDTGWACIPNTGTGVCVPISCPFGTIFNTTTGVCDISNGGGGSPICTAGTICPNGIACPINGICPCNPLVETCGPTCTAGTTCPSGVICPVNGVCPGLSCAYGTVFNVSSGVCEDCDLNPGLDGCESFIDFCTLHPANPICSKDATGTFTGIAGDLQCNTLGITFTNTAVTPAGTCSLTAIILAILQWIAWLIGLLAVFSGLRAAYLYITSVGNEEKLRQARSYLIYTTVGVGVAIISFGMVAITRAILNI